MKEADFQRRVTDMATRFGWRWWHVPAPMRKAGDQWIPAKEAAGLPDLILMHDDPPRMIFAEVKGDGGKLSEHQIEFLAMACDVAEAVVEHPALPKIVGVYAWFPENEAVIEGILRSRVLF